MHDALCASHAHMRHAHNGRLELLYGGRLDLRQLCVSVPRYTELTAVFHVRRATSARMYLITLRQTRGQTRRTYVYLATVLAEWLNDPTGVFYVVTRQQCK